MPYLTGVLSIERVIRPNAVEELLCLKPSNGGKAVIFDLEISMQRAGLCEFIRECEVSNAPLSLEANGAIKIPDSMAGRFEFYREFYGLTRWAVTGVEILQVSEKESKSDEKKNSGEDNKEMKKLDPEPPPPLKKSKIKIFKKLEARPLNTVPASIVWIADGPGKKASGPKNEVTPPALSSRLGGAKIGMNRVRLGRPASGIKSIGGFGRS